MTERRRSTQDFGLEIRIPTIARTTSNCDAPPGEYASLRQASLLETVSVHLPKVRIEWGPPVSCLEIVEPSSPSNCGPARLFVGSEALGFWAAGVLGIEV